MKSDGRTIANDYVDVARTTHPTVNANAEEHELAAASDALVTDAAHDLRVRTEAVERDIREWVALGWMPSQAARRTAYERALATRTASTEGDAVVIAALTARMQESLGLDWMQVSTPECKYDPTMCAAAARQLSTGVRMWFSRAATNYALCEKLGQLQPDHGAWVRHCHERATYVRYMMRARSE